MTTYNWIIKEMDRLTANGFVTTVHYIVTAQDGEYNSSTYGTVEYAQESNTYVPYAELTEEKVIEWVQASLNKNTVETDLQNKIDDLKNPVQASGLPWQ